VFDLVHFLLIPHYFIDMPNWLKEIVEPQIRIIPNTVQMRKAVDRYHLGFSYEKSKGQYSTGPQSALATTKLLSPSILPKCSNSMVALYK
jgi:hypothetical protein